MTSTKKIQKIGRSLNILSNLNSQRSNRKFCDVELVVSDKQFPTHRNILAASSEYFDVMFSSKMREEKEKTVVIKGITPSAMTLILDYIYTDIITLTDDNVGEVLQAASLLTILELQDIIKEYLVEALKPSTCLFFRDLGSLYSLENVVVEANKCLKENFEEVSTQSDFCNLEVAELEYLISSDEIMVKDECKVFEAILIWIKHDDENRKKYFFGLFIHVRLQLISLYYLSDKVRTEALVRQSSECRDLVEDAFHFHADPNRFKFQSLRRGQEKGAINNFILCYGGLGLILYNPSKEMWIRWNLPSQPDLSYSTPVSFGNGTAFCGSDTGPSTKVTLFDGNDFLPMPPMVKARAKASADCVFGDILIFGGELSSIFAFPSDGHSSGFRSIADDFEIYEPGKKQWKIAGKLPNGPRSEAATVVVKESVYLLGGFQSIEDRGPSHYYSRASKDACNRFDVYNHSTKIWTTSRHMNSNRASFGAVMLDNRIYCVGGWENHCTQIATAEFFDITTGQWTNLAMITPWFGSTSMCKVGGTVYAFGISKRFLYSLNTGENSWVPVSKDEQLDHCHHIITISWKPF